MSTTSVIYADHSASTPPHPEVIRTLTEVTQRIYANPSSIHEWGGQADLLVQRARAVIAEALRVKHSEVLFTSGATESNNLAVFGAVRAMQSQGKPVHVIVSKIEHASVYACYEQLEREGVEVTYLPVNASGLVEPEQLKLALKPHTALVSIMHVNNETGSIQPLKELGALIKAESRALFHVDGVQGLGKLPVELASWKVDLYSLSGHKIRAPKGVGLLIHRGQFPLKPLMYGGSQEKGLRPGTMNVPSIVALAKGVRLAAEGQEAAYGQLRQLHDQLVDYLQTQPQLIINSPLEEAFGAPHIINVSFVGMKPEVVVHAMEKRGVILSTQSACSSKLDKPSRVLTAMTKDNARAASGLRISLAPDMTLEQVELIAKALAETVNELKGLIR